MPIYLLPGWGRFRHRMHQHVTQRRFKVTWRVTISKCNVQKLQGVAQKCSRAKLSFIASAKLIGQMDVPIVMPLVLEAWHFRRWKLTQPGTYFPKAALFFGCRNPEQDPIRPLTFGLWRLPSCAGFESATFFLFAVLSSGERQDWLFKDEMNAAVKLGGGCAALARMQVPPLRCTFFRRSSKCISFGKDLAPVVAMTGCLAACCDPRAVP